MDIAVKQFPFQSTEVKGAFSLPPFYENHDAENGLINPELKKDLLKITDSIGL